MTAKALSIVVFLALGVSPSLADGETLDVGFSNFAARMRLALRDEGARGVAVRAVDECAATALPPITRRVCVFKAGQTTMMIAGSLGDEKPKELTVICPTSTVEQMADCVEMWRSAMRVAGGRMDEEQRAAVVRALVSGGASGANKITIESGSRRYILQSVSGFWFHVQAVGAGKAIRQ